MSEYRFTIQVAAPPERVWDLWVDLDRASEWIEGITRITDRVGTPGQTGSRHTTHFGPMRSPSQVIRGERPRSLHTKFGSWLLRGDTQVTFTPDAGGTRIDQTFRTQGIIPAISARLFAVGSYKGSFQGELETFKRLVEREAASSATLSGTAANS